MARVELIMPKMGESVSEATIISWTKEIGENVELDETIVEIATDKVDSEVPSPVAGVLGKQLFGEDEVVEVGKAIATIITEGADVSPSPAVADAPRPLVHRRRRRLSSSLRCASRAELADSVERANAS